ncbi:hypothetical protein [Erythrobacter mangrovi]|uniref:UrcA family protein n=1 Tax=Erythrobacter mangrovi TaxID=2739433 RepID=A0A7D3XG45_9SPHN|nr:hypothetical protein [Erythrobacter mangrovi]QKG70193.1 hypothetical protein HQR01_01735 [Erythrobacter mangrovi]
MRFLATSAAAILVVAAPVIAQESQPATDETAAVDKEIVVEGEKEDSKLDKVVCRTERIVGSRLATAKRCQTRRQWAADRAQDRRDIERIQNSRETAGGG